ncbi:acetyltransferase [bacterium]|nr:acetyltransferase [bacterium]
MTEVIVLNNIFFLGMGDLAKELHAYLVTAPDFSFNTNFYFYDDAVKSDLSLNGFSIGYVSDIQSAIYSAESIYFLTVSSGRESLYNTLKENGFIVSSFLHHTAIVSPFSTFGEGCIFFPHSVVSCNAQIGNSNVFNSFVGVGHDVVIGDFNTFSSRVDLTGHVKIENSCFFGPGSVVLPGKSICDNCSIGPNVVVYNSLKSPKTLFNLPPRPLSR